MQDTHMRNFQATHSAFLPAKEKQKKYFPAFEFFQVSWNTSGKIDIKLVSFPRGQAQKDELIVLKDAASLSDVLDFEKPMQITSSYYSFECVAQLPQNHLPSLKSRRKTLQFCVFVCGDEISKHVPSPGHSPGWNSLSTAHCWMLNEFIFMSGEATHRVGWGSALRA